MYPVSLKISGFKSFADPTSLSFSLGVSAVVGPNGCGKSNIIEALRWVMGEGSARRLRSGSDMEEVIFAGSKERPPFSRAEVTLCFERLKVAGSGSGVSNFADSSFTGSDFAETEQPRPVANDKEYADKEYADKKYADKMVSQKISGQKGIGLLAQLRNEDSISVSRRIESGGGSTYRINGKEALARDVQTLCADMGLGANASALVGQGQVAELVNAKPSERRLLIEEAAGVRGLYARRSDALSGLDSTQATLERVEERLQEDAKRIKTLEQEAAHAARYRELSRQITRLQAAELVREDSALSSKQESLRLREAKLSTSQDSTRASLAELDAQIIEAQESCDAAEKQEQLSAVHCQRLSQEILLLERSREETQEKRSALEQRRTTQLRSRAEQEQATVEAEQLWQDAQAVIASSARLQVAGKTASDAAKVKAIDASDANDANDRDSDSDVASEASINAKLAKIDTALPALEQQLASLGQRLRELERNGAIYAERLDVSRKAKERIEHELTKLSSELQGNSRASDANEPAEIVAADTSYSQLSVAELSEEVAALESSNDARQRKVLPRLRRLDEELLEQRERAHNVHLALTARLQAERDDQRAALRLASSALAEVDDGEQQSSAAKPKSSKPSGEPSSKPSSKPVNVKPLLEDIKVPPDMARALFGALGDDLFASLQAPSKRYWLALPAPASTTSSSSATSPTSVQSPLPEAPLPEGVSSLAEWLELSPRARAALAGRLGQVGLVSSQAEGDALQGSLRQGQRLVLRDGSSWRWDGLRSGAGVAVAAEQRYGSFLQWKELKLGLAKSEAALQRAEQDYAVACEEAAGRLAATRSDYQTALGEEKTSIDRLQVLRKVLREAESKAESLSRALEEQRSRVAQLNLDLDSNLATGRLAEASMAALAAVPGLEKQRGDLARRREALLQERAGLLADKQRISSQLAREREEHSKRLETEQRLRSLKDKNSQSLSNIVSSVREIEQQLEDLSSRPALDLRELAASKQQHSSYEAARARDKNAFERAHKLLASKQDRRRTLALRSTELDKELVHLQGKGEHLPSARAQLATRSQEELSYPLAELRERYELDDAFLSENADLQKAARRSAIEKRARLGEINFVAQQSLAGLKSEHEQRLAQRKDVSDALTRLRLSVRKLESDASSKLLRVREEVGERFSIFITRLFGGGDGHIFFSDPDDPINSGLEIRLSLPGKRIKSLSAMSGGEQSLVAIALILSVFSVAGGKFCILDEVDAALDDVNVSRFCDLLDDLARTGATRFLVITHHHYTMSRAVRLYGVAMPEPGCSRIVSVALDEAIERARTAAE